MSHESETFSVPSSSILTNDVSTRMQVECASQSDIDRAVPAVLDSARIQELYGQFLSEYAPRGPTEMVLVDALARHAAAMHRWDEGSTAIEREAARNLPNLAKSEASLSDSAMDVALAGAMSTEAADRGERHSLLRSRAFLRLLEKLETVQAARRERESRGAAMPPLGFADEAACERYLIDRLQRGLVPCPNCGAKDGCLLETRKCRECRGCKLQIGLRGNTIMARSPVPLRLWFDAVRILLWRPTIGAAELAERIGLPRIATVRSMMAKIRTAMASEDASERLAGLDRHFASNSTT